jgi:hypothetical protein
MDGKRKYQPPSVEVIQSNEDASIVPRKGFKKKTRASLYPLRRARRLATEMDDERKPPAKSRAGQPPAAEVILILSSSDEEEEFIVPRNLDAAAASLPCQPLSSGSAVTGEDQVESIALWLLSIIGNGYSNMEVVRNYAKAFVEGAGADSVQMIVDTCEDSDVDECVHMTVHRRIIKKALLAIKKASLAINEE